MNRAAAAPPATALALPKPLAFGARVRIVGPSGPFELEPFRAGVNRLEERYQVEWDPRLTGRKLGYLAGTDDERLEELENALGDPSVDAVWLARGGFGLSRIMARLSLERFKAHPKWFVGFSDGTVLHLSLARHAHSSLHAANVTGLGVLGQGDWEATLDCLEGRPQRALSGLRAWNSAAANFGNAELPPVLGGNLTVLFAEAVAGRLQLTPGCTLLLEDVSETSYRIDRMLSALLDGGHLRTLSAIILGDFWQCSEGKFGVPTERVLREHLSTLGLPVFAMPVGHAVHNAPILLGQTLRI